VRTLDERILYRTARVINGLPRSAQRALAGGVTVRDGHELDPEVALLLRFARSISAEDAPSIAHYREEQRKNARVAGGPAIEVARVTEMTISSTEGDLRARHYVPDPRETSSRPPLLLFLHGGGFVFGDLDTHDAPCRYLCRHAGVHVLSVEYRLAPEHRFPAAALDARAALRWAMDNAHALGADASRVGVAGDSAGGNLAAVASWMAARDGGPSPVAQVLVYPAIDRRRRWRSLETFAEGFFLTHDSIRWFHCQYAGDHDAAPDPRLNPLAADDLAGLPRTLVVTAGFDPLRDEGEAYAEALAKAGNHVTHRRFGSLVHGFFNMVGVSRASREAVIEIAGATRVLLSSR
jgi:acetyl esterase